MFQRTYPGERRGLAEGDERIGGDGHIGAHHLAVHFRHVRLKSENTSEHFFSSFESAIECAYRKKIEVYIF